jgi:PAS domain S-box-containing protein/putative nucleotidyltransferase with HDIG domain
MRGAQELLKAIADGTSDSVFVKDLEGRYLLFNQAAAAATEKSPDEVIGHDDTFLFPEEEAAVVMQGDRAVMAGGVTTTYQETVTTERGVTVYSSTKGPVFGPDGSVRGIFGIARDTTEQVIAEEALRGSEARLRQALEQVSAAFDSTIELLAQVVETRDPYTAGHERRVSELSVRIAQEMGMSDDDVEEIRIAALIHDIGKISVPAEILSKPGALADMEFELIKAHSVAGYNILTAARFAQPVAEIVYQHHERCDGSGYPRGLGADQILQSAKVIMVADVVEAMSSHRPYRAALGIDVARKEIERGAGREYDAAVAEACSRVLNSGFEFTEYKLSETGVRGRPMQGGPGPRSVA